MELLKWTQNLIFLLFKTLNILIYWLSNLVLSHRLRQYSYCICFTGVFIQFVFLCLSLCRSGTAHTDVNKALLWRLSEWTPATSVALWTEKLLCDFQKPVQSHSMECGSQSIVSGFQEHHMTGQITKCWSALEVRTVRWSDPKSLSTISDGRRWFICNRTRNCTNIWHRTVILLLITLSFSSFQKI